MFQALNYLWSCCYFDYYGKSTVFTFCHKLLLMGLMLFGETICFNCPFLLIYGNIWLKIRWAKGRNKIVNSNIIIIKHLCFSRLQFSFLLHVEINFLGLKNLQMNS